MGIWGKLLVEWAEMEGFYGEGGSVRWEEWRVKDRFELVLSGRRTEKCFPSDTPLPKSRKF